MSIFDATSGDESPMDFGQEESQPAEDQQDNTGADNQEDADPHESQSEAEESPSGGSEQGDEAQGDYVPANTYNELRKGFTQKSQEAAELRRQIEAMQRQAQPPGQGQGQAQEPRTMAEFQQGLNQKIASMRTEGYHETVIDLMVKADTAEFKSTLLERRLDASLSQQTHEKNREHIQAVLGKLEADYPDLATNEGREMIAGKVQEIARELGTPQIVGRPSERILRLAAGEIWGDNKAELYAKAKAKGKQEALETIKAKQGVTPSVTKKPAEQPKSLEDQAADIILNAGRSGGIFG